jgi:hypothetical protein
MSLTPEQIESNWQQFLGLIDLYISSPRKEKLLEFYNKYEERFCLMPASHKKEYHNCFPGGYVDHVLRVVNAALDIDMVWKKYGVKETYTTEELVFAALNHDVGKFGDFENEAVIPNPSEWHVKNRGEIYAFNPALAYMTVPDRGLWLLTQFGIEYSQNEMLAIKLHDGLYNESNKPYLMTWMPETKPRTSLIYIVHQADLMAARIEFEHEALDRFVDPRTVVAPKKEPRVTAVKNKEEAFKSISKNNPGFADMLKNL